MQLIEDSKGCYERLIKSKKSKKFLRTLGKIKEACDKIEAFKGVIAYAAVANIADVAYSTIANAKDTHHLYLTLRIQEQDAKNKSKVPGPSVKAGYDRRNNETQRYPASDLDDKSRLFIDELWSDNNLLKSRNQFLEKLQQELEARILNHTHSNPLSAAQMVRAGVDDKGSMLLISSDQGNESIVTLSADLKSALNKILTIHDLVGKPLLLDEQGALVFITPSRKHVLLVPKERRVIEEALKGRNIPQEVRDGEY